MSEEPLLTWKGRRVRTPGGPEVAAQKVPQSVRAGSLFFVPSPLEGWGLDALLDKLPDDAAVLVYEHDAELEAFCEPSWRAFLGSRTEHPRLFRLKSDDEASVRQVFDALPLSKLRRCEFLPLNGAWMAHAARYRTIFERFEQGLTRWWSNRMTEIHMGPLWLRNLLDNLARATFSRGPWPKWNEEVLVCGAGVTLEEAVTWARGRPSLRLVAADTALPVLKDADLKPDAVVCLEAQHANLRDFAGWLGSDIELFTDMTSYPPSTRVLGRPPRWLASEFSNVALWRRWPWDNQVPRLPPLGSVGVAAVWVALRLTDGPVYLAGLDFSYPPGKTHARGAPALAALAARTHRRLPMEQVGTWSRPGLRTTASGWLTTPVMEGYAATLSELAAPHRMRLRTLGAQGLPLGIDPVGDPFQVPRSKATARGIPEGPSPQAWLEAERVRWEALLVLFQKMNADPKDEVVWSKLEAGLREVDYLTFWFPDPAFRRESDWLIRAQSQVRWALARTSPRRS